MCSRGHGGACKRDQRAAPHSALGRPIASQGRASKRERDDARSSDPLMSMRTGPIICAHVGTAARASATIKSSAAFGLPSPERRSAVGASDATRSALIVCAHVAVRASAITMPSVACSPMSSLACCSHAPVGRTNALLGCGVRAWALCWSRTRDSKSRAAESASDLRCAVLPVSWSVVARRCTERGRECTASCRRGSIEI